MSTKNKSNNSNQLVKKYNLQMTVKDGNDVIAFTNEQAERYLDLKKKSQTALTDACKSLVQIQQERLYLMEYYTSMKEFVTDALNISYETAQRYMSLEKTFGSLGVDYSSLPASKLFEIAKDTDKMEKLSSPKTKDKEGKLLGFIEELKLRDKLKKQQKEDAKSEGSNSEPTGDIPLENYTTSIRQDLVSLSSKLLNGQFDWENKVRANEVGKLLEDMRGFLTAIPPLYLENIENIRAEFRPIEEEEAARQFAEQEANRRMSLSKDNIQDAEISDSEDSAESDFDPAKEIPDHADDEDSDSEDNG